MINFIIMNTILTVYCVLMQGTDAMIARYKNSSLLSRDAIYRPLLFYTDSDVIQHGDRAEENGVIVGKQKPFPVGGRYH